MYEIQEMKRRFLKLFCVFFSLILIPTYSGNVFDSRIDSSSALGTIYFSGYQWYVKSSAGEKWGPGPNYFNDSTENVWVDSNGSLHLHITYDIYHDLWYCAEIYSVDSFGYGTYNFTLSPGFESLDKNVVLGLFTYLDDDNEIDIEFAKWGQNASENGQYVIQPSWKLNHKIRFDFNPDGEDSIHIFTWCKNTIDFRSYTLSRSQSFDWRYYGTGIPQPRTEHVNLNLWLMQGLAPSDYSETEIIIKSFKFLASDCSDSPIGFWWIMGFILIGLLSIGAVGIILINQTRKKGFLEAF